MSELLRQPDTSFNEYRDFVTGTRFSDEPETEWKDAHAEFIQSEMLELLTQHGHGSLLLLPDAAHAKGDSQELRYKMADEMGDSLWFSFNIASILNKDIADICTDALQTHVSDAKKVTSFKNLADQVLHQASEIKVINKLGLSVSAYGVTDPKYHYTSLQDNPFYVLMRTTNRLVKALEEGNGDITPPLNASSIEPTVELPQALGDYMLALTFVAQDRLGVSIEDVARFNVAKISHRQVHGKANDIHFDESYVH